MLNSFDKPEDSKNCYLIASNIVEQNILSQDKLSIWDEALQDNKIDEYFKIIIRMFLIPYKISELKYSLNKEYYEGFTTDKHVAPSLKVIQKNPFDKALGYPEWFFIAFPDVALWAMIGSGHKLIMEKFQNCPEENIVEGDHIKLTLLREIIQMYLHNTLKSL